MKKPKRVGIALSTRDMARQAFESCRRVFERHNVTLTIEKKLDLHELKEKRTFLQSDCIIVFGGDGSFLKVCQAIQTKTPLFLVGCGERNRLGTIDADQAPKQIEQILNGQYQTEQRTRLQTSLANAPLALNDVVIVPRTSATVLHYELLIENQRAWHEYADGVIVCTPSGSGAYFTSTGGTTIDPTAPVFGITGLNALEQKNRHIVSDHKKIRIQKISCTGTVEAVLDGQLRFEISDDVLIQNASNPISLGFVKKTVSDQSPKPLSPSARFVLSVLVQRGSCTQSELANQTGFSTRSIRRALTELKTARKITHRPYSKDHRQDLYLLI